MRSTLFTRALLALSVTIFFSCGSKKENDELAHHHHEHANHNHEHAGHNHDDGHHDDDEEEDAIRLDPAKALKFGVEVTEVQLVPFTEAIKVSGEITAPPSTRRAIVARNAGLLSLGKNISTGAKLSAGQTIATVNGSSLAGGDDMRALQIEYEAAQREMERMSALYEKGLVAAKDFYNARTAAEKAKAALGGGNGNTTGGTVTAPIAGTLISLEINDGDYVTAGQTIGYVGDNATLSLKAELPKRLHSKLPFIEDALIVPTCDDCEQFLVSESGGRRLDGNSAVADEISGYIPVYFSFKNNGRIEGSGFTEVYLMLEQKDNVLSVPETALTEQQGKWFVYVQLDEDCYEKRPVMTGGSNGRNIEIKSGLQPGEKVVSSGVTFVKLAENADVVPEGHSHTH